MPFVGRVHLGLYCTGTPFQSQNLAVPRLLYSLPYTLYVCYTVVLSRLPQRRHARQRSKRPIAILGSQNVAQKPILPRPDSIQPPNSPEMTRGMVLCGKTVGLCGMSTRFTAGLSDSHGFCKWDGFRAQVSLHTDTYGI